VKFEKICILGLGYIGLPTAAMFSANGIKVVGVDTNPSVVETLKAGRLHIHEPGLGEVLEKAIVSGNLTVSSAPEPADAFLIAVPTPFFEHETGQYNGQAYKKADMRAVTSATRWPNRRAVSRSPGCMSLAPASDGLCAMAPLNEPT